MVYFILKIVVLFMFLFFILLFILIKKVLWLIFIKFYFLLIVIREKRLGDKNSRGGGMCVYLMELIYLCFNVYFNC